MASITILLKSSHPFHLVLISITMALITMFLNNYTPILFFFRHWHAAIGFLYCVLQTQGHSIEQKDEIS